MLIAGVHVPASQRDTCWAGAVLVFVGPSAPEKVRPLSGHLRWQLSCGALSIAPPQRCCGSLKSRSSTSSSPTCALASGFAALFVTHRSWLRRGKLAGTKSALHGWHILVATVYFLGYCQGKPQIIFTFGGETTLEKHRG